MIAIAILLVFLATFTAAAIAVVIASLVLVREAEPEPAEGAANADFTGGEDGPLLLREESLSSISIWHELLNRLDLVENLKTSIAQAGLRWSVGRVTLFMLLSGTIAAGLLIGIDWTPPGTALIGGIAASLPPYFYIRNRRKARFRKIEDQLPDALDSLARAMRAGHPFSGGMDILANELPAPLGPEIRTAVEEWRLGMAWSRALANLAKRLPLLEIRLFAAAVVMQNRTGGKLSEVLERLADTIRDSISLRGDVQAISANGRLTGLILTLLPVGIATIMFFTSPGYIGMLLKYQEGKYLILASGICIVAGHFVIKKIVTIRA